MSHEIRTPLTAVVGFAELLAERPLDPIVSHGYVEPDRDRRPRACWRLVNDILDYSRMEAGTSASRRADAQPATCSTMSPPSSARPPRPRA
jgi:signal transduction histidine kinase